MQRFLLHVSFWLGFFFIWNQITYFYISDKGNRLYFSALDVSLIACAFYGIYAYLMPRYFKHKNIAKLLALSLIYLILLAGGYAFVMKLFLNHMLVPIHFNFSWNYTDLQYNRFFIALLGLLGGGALKLALDRVNAQRRLNAMEKANSLAELNYLKAQLNPHFLFNSLNSLYTQLDFDLPQAKVILVTIADLLRYQLYECSADFVPLSKELLHLENYFNLQRIRTEATTILNVKVDDNDLMISPLVLMTFVENAFKHVSDDDSRENIIQIDIQLTEGKLHFFCMNTASVKEHLSATFESMGIGLQNVRQRLELLYSNKYELTTKELDSKYYIYLNLILR
ncbi:Histidine kinase [Filimonas lacunae]|uniref:Histidine kinase n=1 Tax=Filimonas lacunae TaxID=477680 RepID=A0A173MG84_9BACT|nr:histidine kinase [Filimonas lacunae]BAV06441.1 two-component system sensor protein, no kinase domain [Filimonas lacunae]SIT26970.1 Histidine kinase [Filimonas lacunae]